MSRVPMIDPLPPIDEILSHLTVRDIMTTEMITVRPSLPVRDLLDLLVEHHISGVPVVGEDGAAIGVVSATDVLRLSTFASDETAPSNFDAQFDDVRSGFFLEQSSHGSPDALEGWQVSDVMTPVPFSVSPDATLPDLARTLFRGRIHRALVMRDGDLLGIVTASDIVRAVAASQD